MTPFVVFSLPRSRSAWLSTLLGCGHDIGVECETPEEFVGKIGIGTCETGAAFAWPLIRQLLPDAPFVVVKRPVEDVCASFARLGIIGLEPEMRRRDAQLDEISAQSGVLTVGFADLRSAAVCGGVYAHCLGRSMDLASWQRLETLNIQVDILHQMARLETNRPRIAKLKAEVARRMAKPGLQIAQEPWSGAFWSEAETLAKAHFEEVDGGVESGRSLNLNLNVMQWASDNGTLKLFTARMSGRLVGYYTWNISDDVESRGLLIAQQGAWYVAHGYPRAAYRMFDFAISELARMGVQYAYPHHRAQGRGADLGKFFRRRGAKKIQDTYSLRIGGLHA